MNVIDASVMERIKQLLDQMLEVQNRQPFTLLDQDALNDLHAEFMKLQPRLAQP